MTNPSAAMFGFALDPDLVELFVDQLTLHAHIGVYAHEKGRTQPLIVTMRVWVTVDVQHDELAETVSYKLFADAAEDLAATSHFQLVETFLEALAVQVMADERVKAAWLQVSKPEAIPGANGAGAAIFRCRD